jgi:hypothetical protein
MSKLLLNFAFATTIYSEKRNYLETFSPFVLQALCGINRYCTPKEICEYLEKNSNLIIPTNTSRSILRVLSREKYAEEQNNSTRIEFKSRITEKGLKYLNEFTETEEKIKRKHNEFFSDFQIYLKNQNLEIGFDSIEPKVIEFINENLHHLTLFSSNGKLETNFRDGLKDKFNLNLVNFISEIEHHKPQLYETFEELLKGAILWGHIANQEELPEKESTFDPLTIYLDANIILSLLELHHPSINEAASQLLKLLKGENKISLKVLSITLDEIGRLLKTYKNKKDNYNTNIGVNSVFYFLKRQGYDELKTIDLINNLDMKIIEKGILVEKQEFIDIGGLKAAERDLYQTLYSFNKDINDKKREGDQKEENALHLSTLHDATVISRVRSERGAWVKSLERAKVIFLTESFRLDEFCNERYRTNDTFPEVILDLTLTNILWLKNPKNDFGVQLHKLIAVHSKKILIDNGIWTKFTITLRQLHKSKDLTARQYAVLFSSNQLTINYLHNIRPEQITLTSLTELSKKIETDILKDKSAKLVKDSIIEQKNIALKDVEGEIVEKIKEIENKDRIIEEKENTIEDLKLTLSNSEEKIFQQGEKLNTLEKNFGFLQKEIEEKTFIEKRMEEEYNPLAKRSGILVIVAIVALILIYFSQVADIDDQTRLGMTPVSFKLCKFIAIVLFALIAGWLGKAYKKEFWLYLFLRKKLKSELKLKFIEEYRKKTP